MTDAGHYAVAHFERFQHYKNRAPAWIKLYASTLDDYAFVCLTDAQKWHLVGLWILASKMENRLPTDETWLANRIGATSDFSVQPLIVSGFIVLEGPEKNASTVRRKRASTLASKTLALEEKRREEKNSECEHFASAWSRYPSRPGQSRAAALKAWTARVREGVDPAALLAGVEAYAAYVRREGTQPKFVKHAATFFGPDRHWEADYGAPLVGEHADGTLEPYMPDGITPTPAFLHALGRTA